MEFSEKTKKILAKSGWYTGRNIDINNIIKLLELRQFEITEPVKDFLKEFGMLTIDVPVDYISESVMKGYNHKKFDTHTTDVFLALGDAGDYYCTTPFEEFAGEKMAIVGKVYNRNLWLMISGSGKVYCDSGKLGDNYVEAFETLFNPIDRRIIAWQYL